MLKTNSLFSVLFSVQTLFQIPRVKLSRASALYGATVRLGADTDLEVNRSAAPALKERFGIKGDFYRRDED